MDSSNQTKETVLLANVTISDASDLGKLVRKKRKQLKMTQKVFAGMCNVGVRFVSDLENGKSTLEFDKVLKVSNYLGFTIIAKG